MIMKTKPFNQEVHDANDPKSKEVVLKYLNKIGLDAYENPNKYGIDIVVDRFELKRRTIWSGDTFPFDTIHIPYRKKKFFKFDAFYCVLNKEYTYMLCCPSSIIRKSLVLEVCNKSVPEDEYFYDISVDEFTLIDLKGGKHGQS